jgi:hypothetical protein
MKVQPEWMLTWPEIVATRLEYTREVSYQARLKGESTEFDFTNKAQARKIVEWLRQPCKHREQPLADVPMSHGCRVIIMRYYRGDCPICMEQLRKDVEL